MTCPVCGASRVRRYCRKGDADYHVCANCRTIFQFPVPDRRSMLGYVDAEYDGGLYREYVDARDMKLEHFRHRMEVLSTRVGHGGRLIDIGCSCGYLMEVAADQGYDVHGVEFSAGAIAAARPEIRERIIRGSIDQLSGEHGGRYDVVTAFDIIEHIERPSTFLERASWLLRPGGILFISTPDADHWLRPLMASRWPMLQPMQHLTLLSRRSLQMALNDAGFDDVVVKAGQKTLSYDYLLGQVRSLNPWLFAGVKATTRLVPAAVMNRRRQINIGEIVALARKTN